MYVQPFLANPRNASFLARMSPHIEPAARTARSIGLLICMAVSFLFLLGAWSNWQTDMRFAANGVNTEGTILSSRSSVSSRSRLYYVTYQFSAQTGTQSALFTNEVGVDNDTYDSAYVGKSVTVRYLPDDPNTSELAGQSNLATTIACIVLCLGLLVASLFIFRSMRRVRRFEREGRILPAVLVAHTYSLRGTRGRQTLWLNMRYQFQSPSGTEITGNKISQRKEKQPIPLQSGTPLAVLYLDDKNYLLL